MGTTTESVCPISPPLPAPSLKCLHRPRPREKKELPGSLREPETGDNQPQVCIPVEKLSLVFFRVSILVALSSYVSLTLPVGIICVCSSPSLSRYLYTPSLSSLPPLSLPLPPRSLPLSLSLSPPSLSLPPLPFFSHKKTLTAPISLFLCPCPSLSHLFLQSLELSI